MRALAEPNHECKGRGFEGGEIVILKLILPFDSKSSAIDSFCFNYYCILLLICLDEILFRLEGDHNLRSAIMMANEGDWTRRVM